MYLRQFLLAGLLSVIAFASCKKNNDAPSAIPIEGSWAGKYSILSEPYNSYYSFSIKAGGVLELQDAQLKKTGEGTWQLNDGIFTGTYTLLAPASGTFSVIANFHKTTGKLDGTWGTGTKEYGGGYWFMDKTK
jgi:hypothetical protein